MAFNSHDKRRFKQDLYRRRRGRCYYCEKQGKFDDMTLDHIISLAAGGPNSRDNLRLACRACNERKGSTPAWEFATDARTSIGVAEQKEIA
jgi:5-methylcytosine-specific restriction endonuclease McrA